MNEAKPSSGTTDMRFEFQVGGNVRFYTSASLYSSQHQQASTDLPIQVTGPEGQLVVKHLKLIAIAPPKSPLDNLERLSYYGTVLYGVTYLPCCKGCALNIYLATSLVGFEPLHHKHHLPTIAMVRVIIISNIQLQF